MLLGDLYGIFVPSDQYQSVVTHCPSSEELLSTLLEPNRLWPQSCTECAYLLDLKLYL